jgi:ubiquinone biosynthesis protein
LGPARIANDVKDGFVALHRIGRMAPEIAKQAEKMSDEISHMTEHGLRFDEETAENIGRAEAKHSKSGRLALWVIAATLIYIAYQVV